MAAKNTDSIVRLEYRNGVTVTVTEDRAKRLIASGDFKAAKAPAKPAAKGTTKRTTKRTTKPAAKTEEAAGSEVTQVNEGAESSD